MSPVKGLAQRTAGAPARGAALQILERLRSWRPRRPGTRPLGSFETEGTQCSPELPDDAVTLAADQDAAGALGALATDRAGRQR
jgi:hypothetical protein